MQQHFPSTVSSAMGFENSMQRWPGMSANIFKRASGKVTFDYKSRLVREFNMKMFLLDEKYPTKFATTSWLEAQLPYAIYRAAVLIYAVVILIWEAHQASLNSMLEVWLVSLPTWTFILFTLYALFCLLFTILQFFDDCLCNDDLRWYHRLIWVVQSSIFNSAILCFFGALTYDSSGSSDSTVHEYAQVFSSNVSFTYIIGLIMIIEVFITNITMRLLHVIYPFTFYLIHLLFHIFRWGAGYTPVYVVLDYGTHTSTAIGFCFLLILLFCPTLHLLGYTVDTLRCVLLVTCIDRHRKRFLQVSSAAGGGVSTTRGGTSGRPFQSSRGTPPINGSSLSEPRTEPMISAIQLFTSGNLAYY